MLERASAPPTRENHAQQPPTPQAERLAAYVHIDSTDHWDPDSFWFTDRQNVIGEPIDDRWDPLKVINTDRPDFTDVAPVVGDGVVQVETGFLKLRKWNAGERSSTETIPNSLLRVGYGRDFEWRMKWRGGVTNELTDRTNGAKGRIEGPADVELGFKWVMREQEDWLPMSTLVTRLNVPVGSRESSAEVLEPGMTYIYNWQVRRWWFIRGCTGFDLYRSPGYSFATSAGNPVLPTRLLVDHDEYLEFSQAISSYMQLSKRVGMFAEWFMFKRHGSEDDHSDHFHNYGLYVYLTPDIQLDARFGWRIGDHYQENLLGFGLSFRY